MNGRKEEKISPRRRNGGARKRRRGFGSKPESDTWKSVGQLDFVAGTTLEKLVYRPDNGIPLGAPTVLVFLRLC